MSLNARHQRFVAEYLRDFNGKRAAIATGYSEKTAEQQASRLLRNVKVAEAVAKGQAKRAEKLEISADMIAQELRLLGFSNMQDFMRTGENGEPYLDFSGLTREQAAALAEVTVEDFVDGRGEDARDVRRVKFKLTDKRAALVDLAKLLGLGHFNRHDVNLNPGPLLVQFVEDDE